MLEVLLEQPEQAKAKWDRAMIGIRGELQQARFVIKGAVGEDFRGAQITRSEEVRMDEESVKVSSNVPRAQPFVGLGEFS